MFLKWFHTAYRYRSNLDYSMYGFATVLGLSTSIASCACLSPVLGTVTNQLHLLKQYICWCDTSYEIVLISDPEIDLLATR